MYNSYIYYKYDKICDTYHNIIIYITVIDYKIKVNKKIR